MGNNIVFKFLAFLLASVLLLAVVASAAGIAVLISMDLYSSTVEEAYDLQTYGQRYTLAVNLLHRYASLELGGLPEEYLNEYYGTDWQYETFPQGSYFYSVYDDTGNLVFSADDDVPSDVRDYDLEIGLIYYRRQLAAGEEVTGKAVFTDGWYDRDMDQYNELRYVKEELDGYTVRLYLTDEARVYDAFWQVLVQLYALRYRLFWMLGAALLLFAALAVYLCCAAGRKPGSDEVRPMGLNRLPLDLYTAAVVCAVFILAALDVYLVNVLIYDMAALLMCAMLAVTTVACVLAVALLMAWAAQLKVPGRYWLKNTLIARILSLILRVLRWIGRLAGKGLGLLHSFARLLPVMWQWILACAGMALVPFICFVGVANSWYWEIWTVALVVSLIADAAFVLYSAWCFGTLMRGASRMSQGDLRTKIPTKYLLGCFRDFALQLNSLSEVARVAADKQMRSDRMKTELITNVSHDIKTPLTSIINFVDLLQKTEDEAARQEYLEVLSRQSAQMKKLIEDLIELSKASTGNIAVNLGQVDAAEAVNQALGEFADKLETAQITPVLRKTEEPVMVTADGRLVWRVLFNLLTNAVRYAMPGTRLYIDLTRTEHDVILSLKNISRMELNVSGEELLERFVQGDASRSAGGSGLGLNIAKGLMEAQNGQMNVLVDGDLFKVTLVFPAAD